MTYTTQRHATQHHVNYEQRDAMIRIEQLQRRAAIVEAATVRAHQLRDEMFDRIWARIRGGIRAGIRAAVERFAPHASREARPAPRHDIKWGA